MKLKRCMAIILIFAILMTQFVGVSQAQEDLFFKFELNSNSYMVKQGDTFTITASAKDFANMSNGIIAIGGQLEFDKEVLDVEVDTIKGLNAWRFTKGYYNLNNFKFITDSDEIAKEDCDVFAITFRVKEDTTAESTEISLKSVLAGTGEVVNGILYSEDSSIIINIGEEKEPDDITSEVYIVNKENNTISEIEADTTIATFKSNVTANAEMVFTDNNGNVITDETVVLENGMKLNVGETLEFTLVVKERPIVEDITSEVYNINKENNTISEIEADTTIATFKSNVTTNATLVFVDADGNAIENEATALESGMKVKVGTTYEFTLVVKERPIVEDITSEVYNINKVNNTISEIEAVTTIIDFKLNVETNATLVFVDKNGNVIENEATILENGMKVKVGTTYEFTLVVKERPIVEDITSEVYNINKENNLISEISLKTTIADFRANVETNATLVFVDKNGNVIANEENVKVGTGMKLRVGTTYEFDIMVENDVDGDGELSTNDIALMKLHYIERLGYNLTGLYLKAADVDNDNRISVNDIAQVKLLYIK